jgi:hypothetical protein
MITVAVMVCLLVITMIGAGLLRMGRSQRQLNEREQRALQADWLAESGFARASARLVADPDYDGETWTVSRDELGTPFEGVVLIKVERAADRPDSRTVTVRADYPSDPDGRVRRSKTVVMAFTRGGEGARP